MIAIIDYGAGNLLSVKKAFDFLRVENKVISSGSEFDGFDRIVLPGVGAFGAAMERLEQSGFIKIIAPWLNADKPFLGICLGVQLLFESSLEAEGMKGFSVFQGKCLPFTEGKVPQIGWNQINIKKMSPLLEGINDGSFFYFLHGYYVSPADEDIVTATTNYGLIYPSVIAKGNVYAVQFHPEKSGELGLKLLKNWVDLC
jgi:glutamine amidotransferase